MISPVTSGSVPIRLRALASPYSAMTYTCSICGSVHEDLPDIGFDKPDYFCSVPEAERERRIELTADTCSIDNEDFFIRGVLEIPIIESARTLGFGVWVSQKRENFYTYIENFNSSAIGPFFGWLSTRIPFYEEDTLSLKTLAYFRGGDQRPLIVLEVSDHRLSVDQNNGITMAMAWEIVHRCLGDEAD
jgi:hypothetical protein